MISTRERIEALLGQASALGPWVGHFDADTLWEWLRLELGDPLALDHWVAHGPISSRAVPLSPVLHVVSGNTAHAAFQSVFRGLLVGCVNRVKLPTAGLPEFENWLAGLPAPLLALVVARHDLPADWLACEAAVVFGSGRTLASLRPRLPAGTRLIEHGPKLSIAVVLDASHEVVRPLAEDILRFNQRGCLSVQAVFVDASVAEIHRFGDALAEAMDAFRRCHPRPEPTLQDSGSVANARERARFLASNGAGLKLWESRGSTAWTIVFDPDPTLAPGPLNGFVTLHPMPSAFNAATLGPEVVFLSTVVLRPFTVAAATRLDAVAPPRICAAGEAQQPTVFWHHDGVPPLASLVRWRDFG